MAHAQPEHLSRVLYTLAAMATQSHRPGLAEGNDPPGGRRDSAAAGPPAGASASSVVPRPWLSRFFQQTCLQSFSFGALSISSSMWALATLRVAPPPEWIEAMLFAAFEQ
eukprot:354375-Chlamydomonas_euryale.AAC.2